MRDQTTRDRGDTELRVLTRTMKTLKALPAPARARVVEAMASSEDGEVDALVKMSRSFKPLSPSARTRVLAYLRDHLGEAGDGGQH